MFVDNYDVNYYFALIILLKITSFLNYTTAVLIIKIEPLVLLIINIMIKYTAYNKVFFFKNKLTKHIYRASVKVINALINKV